VRRTVVDENDDKVVLTTMKRDRQNAGYLNLHVAQKQHTFYTVQ
jgi:ribosomal protein L31